MPNPSTLKYDLLFTQIKQTDAEPFWVQLKNYYTEDYNLLNYNSIKLEVSNNLLVRDYIYNPPPESNGDYYLAKLGIHFITFDTLEYRLFIDPRGTRLANEKEIVYIPTPNYLNISIYNARLKRLDGTNTKVFEKVEIIIPTPIEEKEFYILGPEDLKFYKFPLNYYLDYDDTEYTIDDNILSNNNQINSPLETLYNQVTTINLTGFPVSTTRDIVISLIRNSDLVSQTSSFATDSLIPAAQLSLKDNQRVKLYDAAWSLIPLLELGRVDLIKSIIDRLANEVITKQLLTEDIFRDKKDGTLESSIKSYSLLLLNLNYVNYDSPLYNYRSLAIYLRDQLVRALNYTSNNLIAGYDYLGSPVDFEDFGLLILGYISLLSVQEVYYDDTTDFVLTLLQNTINQLVDNNFIDLNKYNIETIPEGLFWLTIFYKVKNNNAHLVKINNILTFYIQAYNSTISLKNKLFINYIRTVLQSKGVSTTFNLYTLSDHYQEIGINLYKVNEQLPESDLLVSSIKYVFDHNLYNNLELNYNVNSNASLIAADLLYQRILAFMPMNSPWFESLSLATNIGVLNALIKGVANSTLPAFIKYFNILNSFDINSTNGRYLDRWGELFKLPRLLGEIDKRYRQRLKNIIRVNAISISNLEASLKTIEPTVTIENLLPRFIKIDGVVTENPDFELLLAEADKSDPKGIYDQNNIFYELSDVLSGIKISASVENLELEIAVSKLQLIGIKVIFQTLKTFKFSYKKGVTFYVGMHDYS